MTIAVPVLMFGWPLVVLLLFHLIKPRRAIIASVLGAWLFLPMAEYYMAGLPNYTKMTATLIGIIAGILLYDSRRLLAFRPGWFDLPMALWCLVSMGSSLANDKGMYDGFSGILNKIISWGIPYFIGRLYFNHPLALRELAIGIIIGGLVYLPLCIFEVRVSPQLHSLLYGFHQHAWIQTKRFGGWRPVVFMEHGLAVGMFMSMSALLAGWLWFTGSLKRLMGLPMWMVFPALAVTAVLCKSLGPVALGALGAAVLLAGRITRSPLPLWTLLALPALYMLVRTVGGWDGQELVTMAGWLDEDRADSLQSRLNSETSIWRAVQSQMLFGFAWFALAGKTVAGLGEIIPDGMWIIALYRNGLVGLAAMAASLLAPPFLFRRRFNPKEWHLPVPAAGGAMAVLLGVYMIDCLFNAMINPIFLMVAGGLVCATAPQPGRVGPHRVAVPVTAEF